MFYFTERSALKRAMIPMYNDKVPEKIDTEVNTEVDTEVDTEVTSEIEDDEDNEDDESNEEYPFDINKATLVSSRPLYPPCCYQVYEELYRDEYGDYWLCCDEYCDLPYDYLTDNEAAEWLEKYGTVEEYEAEFWVDE